MTLPTDQGRAPGLYDEQLQRLQQEKMLCEADRPMLFRRAEGPSQPQAEETKTGAD